MEKIFSIFFTSSNAPAKANASTEENAAAEAKDFVAKLSFEMSKRCLQNAEICHRKAKMSRLFLNVSHFTFRKDGSIKKRQKKILTYSSLYPIKEDE